MPALSFWERVCAIPPDLALMAERWFAFAPEVETSHRVDGRDAQFRDEMKVQERGIRSDSAGGFMRCVRN